MMEAKKVLIISSVTPSVGPAIIAHERYQALTNAGHKVDVLCVETDSCFPEVKGILHKNIIIRKIQRKIIWIRQNIPLRLLKRKGYSFFHLFECIPEVPTGWILRAIHEKYDVIEFLFWQDMASYKTIRDVYRSQKCPIRITCVDFGPMAGGCHFTNGCDRYKNSCTNCPAFSGHIVKRIIHSNIKYRASVLKEVHPYIYINEYMRLFFFKDSTLFKDYPRMCSSMPWVDINKFKKIDVSGLRAYYNIPDSKKFIIFTGSQDLTDKRKGFSYFVESLNIISTQLKEKSREILVLVTGRNGQIVSDNTNIDCLSLGYVTEKELINLYNLADVFVCPSVDDAGPMMVKYSIACGTPVVAFEMGAALSVVKNQGTGCCVKLRDSFALAAGIMSIYNLTTSERKQLSERCVQFAIDQMSEKSFASCFFKDVL